MPAAKLTSKGQITIPKSVRERLGLETGDQVDFAEGQGGFTLRRHVPSQPFRRYLGFLGNLSGERPDELVQDMRGE